MIPVFLAPDIERAGGKFENTEVVVERNLVTSRTWMDLPFFMREFLKVLRGTRKPSLRKAKKLGKGSSCGLQHNGGWTLIVYHRATSAQTFDAWLPTGRLALRTYEVSASPLPTITLPFALESICLRFCREAMTSSSSSGPRASILKMS